MPNLPIDDVLEGLARRRPVPGRVALVCAHPDDETIGAGASLHLFENLLLVHATDGAPGNLDDARAAGFDTAAAYSAARRAELTSALHAGGAHPQLTELHVPDQGAAAEMDRVASDLAGLFGKHRIELVITHAYEGGHPDHDATACAVHLAARRMAVPPSIVEMAGYHADPSNGGLRTGAFLPGAQPPTVVPLDAREQELKRRMLACFVTQRATLAPFGVAQEAFRPAPVYDFTRPPHPGQLHYEKHDWGMTGARFRRLVGELA